LQGIVLEKNESAFSKGPAIGSPFCFDVQRQAKTKTATFYVPILKPPAIQCSESLWSRFYHYLSYALLLFFKCF